MSETVYIDGSHGEGGGQILRTSLALATLRKLPLRIENIREHRPRPGIKRQHLTAIRAAAEICGGELEGDELNSSELFYKPGALKAGDYHFAVGTAGSATLVFQTVLWPLLFAEGDSTVTIEGGTHNPMAPPFDFIERCFLPVVRSMGAKVELRLERYGFAPAGGGRIVAKVHGRTQLSPIDLCVASPIRARRATALVCNLPGTIAIRELRSVREQLGWQNEECLPRVETKADSTGNVLMLEVERDGVCEMVVGFGRRGLPAEDLTVEACRMLTDYLDRHVPVGEMLADQLIIPFAIAGGAFATGPLSLHTRTNIEVVQRFLDAEIRQESIGGGTQLHFVPRS